MIKIIKVIATAALVMSASNALAVVISSTNTADFNLTAESFVPSGFTTANMVSASGDMTLSTNGGDQAGYIDFTGVLVDEEYVLLSGSNFDVSFSSQQTAFAMDYVDEASASTFNLDFFDGLTNVGSTSFAAASFGTAEFIGFISTVAFDRVEVREVGGGSVDEGFQFYTAEVAAVPEPGSLAIFGLGLVGLGYMQRRKTA
jgi:hypothetical protein